MPVKRESMASLRSIWFRHQFARLRETVHVPYRKQETNCNATCINKLMKRVTFLAKIHMSK
jgi:hypothetical protein